MLRFVLASHGKMAEGMRDSIHLILGKSVDICTICAYTQGPDDVIKEIKQMFETFAKEDKVIVMTDLAAVSVRRLPACWLSGIFGSWQGSAWGLWRNFCLSKRTII